MRITEYPSIAVIKNPELSGTAPIFNQRYVLVDTSGEWKRINFPSIASGDLLSIYDGDKARLVDSDVSAQNFISTTAPQVDSYYGMLEIMADPVPSSVSPEDPTIYPFRE